MGADTVMVTVDNKVNHKDQHSRSLPGAPFQVSFQRVTRGILFVCII